MFATLPFAVARVSPFPAGAFDCVHNEQSDDGAGGGQTEQYVETEGVHWRGISAIFTPFLCRGQSVLSLVS
jgi:hypothetical protein